MRRLRRARPCTPPPGHRRGVRRGADERGAESGPPQVNYPQLAVHHLRRGTRCTDPDFSYDTTPLRRRLCRRVGLRPRRRNQRQRVSRTGILRDPGAATTPATCGRLHGCRENDVRSSTWTARSRRSADKRSSRSPRRMGPLESAHDNGSLRGPRLYALYRRGLRERAGSRDYPLIRRDPFPTSSSRATASTTPHRYDCDRARSYDVGLVSKAICPDKDHDCDSSPKDGQVAQVNGPARHRRRWGVRRR